jgi:hypothetical protein
MSAAVMKIMLWGMAPCVLVMGTIIVQEHKASIFWPETAGSIILWNGDNSLPNCIVSHSQNVISNMIHVFWLEMFVLTVLRFINGCRSAVILVILYD